MARLAGRRAPRLRFSRRCVSTPFSSLPETLCSIPDRGKPGIETSDAAGVRAHPSVSGTVDCLPFLLYRGFLVPPLNDCLSVSVSERTCVQNAVWGMRIRGCVMAIC